MPIFDPSLTVLAIGFRSPEEDDTPLNDNCGKLRHRYVLWRLCVGDLRVCRFFWFFSRSANPHIAATLCFAAERWRFIIH